MMQNEESGRLSPYVRRLLRPRGDGVPVVLVTPEAALANGQSQLAEF
jgi:hypothetical protein